MKVTTYGPGGFDPEAADGNVVDEQTVEMPETAQEAADREFREAVTNASTLAELKDALLGTNTTGRAESRPS